MKSSLIFATLVGATLLSGASLADNHKTLLGTWTGKSHTAVIGDSTKHHDTANGPDVKFVRTDFTMVIEAEEGRNFAGYLISKTHKELIAGAFMADMIHGVFTDSDGTATIKRVGVDRLEICYVHVPSPGNQSSVAACIDYERQ